MSKSLCLISCLIAGLTLAEEVVVDDYLAPEEKLTMERAVELALAHNLDMRLARAAREQARYDDWYAWTGFLPQVSGQVLYNTYDGFTAQYGTPADVDMDTYSTSLTISQPLFNGGAIYWGKVMAGAGEEISELSLQAARQAAILAVREAYLDLLMAREYHRVQRANFENLEEHYELSRAQAEVDLISRADMLRSESELAVAEKSLLSAQNALRLSRANLADVIGVTLPAGVELVPVEIQAAPPDLSLTEAQAVARGSNPTLAMARKAERIAEAEVGLAASAFWPKLNLSADYGWVQGEELTFSKEADYWSISAILSIDLFTSTGRLAEMKSARASQYQTKLETLQAERGIMLAVEAAYLALEEAGAQIAVSEKQLAAAAEAMELSKGLYENGILSNVEYLDMNQAYLLAQLGEIQSRYNYLKARENLDSLLGRLSLNEETPSE
jgi:outer membrane protein TolC